MRLNFHWSQALRDDLILDTIGRRDLSNNWEYMSIVREPHRRLDLVAPVNRYPDEAQARVGHAMWAALDWQARIAQPARPYRLLVAEDNPDDIHVIRRLWQEPPAWDLHVVMDGRAALSVIQGHDREAFDPDLIVLSLNMSHLRGQQVLATMREQGLRPTVPVVIWTLSERDEDVQQTFALKADMFVTKTPRLWNERLNLRLVKAFWERTWAQPG